MLIDIHDQAIMQIPAKSIAQAAQRYARRLQHYCLQTPLQWFNFYDFWRIEAR